VAAVARKLRARIPLRAAKLPLSRPLRKLLRPLRAKLPRLRVRLLRLLTHRLPKKPRSNSLQLEKGWEILPAFFFLSIARLR
jgi:hypothetical protein